jgi:hypothetical protein
MLSDDFDWRIVPVLLVPSPNAFLDGVFRVSESDRARLLVQIVVWEYQHEPEGALTPKLVRRLGGPCAVLDKGVDAFSGRTPRAVSACPELYALYREVLHEYERAMSLAVAAGLDAAQHPLAVHWVTLQQWQGHRGVLHRFYRQDPAIERGVRRRRSRADEDLEYAVLTRLAQGWKPHRIWHALSTRGAYSHSWQAFHKKGRKLGWWS